MSNESDPPKRDPNTQVTIGLHEDLHKEQSPVGQVFATKEDIISVGVYLVVFLVIMIWVLITCWPADLSLRITQKKGTAEKNNSEVVTPASEEAIIVIKDRDLIIIVLTCGAIGQLFHAIKSLYGFVGNRQLKQSWILRYTLLPFAGAVLALLFFLTIMAGFIETEKNVGHNALYFYAGISALVGAFSEQATEKLKLIAEAVFAERPETDIDPIEKK